MLVRRRLVLQQMSGEDLMVLRRMIIAGRQLQASNERESQAVAAYRSAVERVIRLTGGSSKPGINRLIDGFVSSKKIHLSSQVTE